KERTCIRLTLIKGINMGMFDQYAQMIMKGSPDFIEVKGYMHVGESRERLQRENMPFHEEIAEFCTELEKHLPDYEIVSEHIASRVLMFAKKKFKIDGVWHTWIDFPKWHELVNSGKEFASLDFVKRTPQTGISGRGTIDRMNPYLKIEQKETESAVFVDEKTKEMEFYGEGL
ncbi:MAG: hypothetical protein Q7K45_04475, partial [Nanoarchaeota archaeon]|nr:hypothetical protein [Nanoarchaeota archaeon]